MLIALFAAGCLGRPPGWASLHIRVQPTRGVGLRMSEVQRQANEILHTRRFQDQVEATFVKYGIDVPRDWIEQVILGTNADQLELILRVRADNQNDAKRMGRILGRALIRRLQEEKQYRARVIWSE